MKSFEHNFNEQSLLLNSTIFYIKEERPNPVLIKIPLIRDSVDDPNFNTFLSFMFLREEDYKKMGLIMKVESAAQGLIALLRESREIRLQLGSYIEKYLLKSEVSSKGILVDDIPLTEQEVDFFRKIILVSYGVERLEEVEDKQEELKKMGAAERAVYEKQKETLKRLEEAKKRKQKISSEDQVNLSKIIVGVMKEFTMTLEDIKDLNYYTLYYLFSYVFKIDHYDFMKRAAASGNLAKNAKIKHWLE